MAFVLYREYYVSTVHIAGNKLCPFCVFDVQTFLRIKLRNVFWKYGIFTEVKIMPNVGQAYIHLCTGIHNMTFEKRLHLLTH